MNYNLISGLSDLSGELGESTTNKTPKRVGYYNDAVVQFAGDRKWPFLVKKNTELTTVAAQQTYTIPASMDDRRSPGFIKSIYIQGSAIPIAPANYYTDEEETTITFLNEIAVTGRVLTIHYYYIPTRLTDPEDTNTEFPIPDRYRKTVSTLAAAFVQWSRYLDAQGNRLYNLYEKMVQGVTNQQSEVNTGAAKRKRHFLQDIGFKRTY